LAGRFVFDARTSWNLNGSAPFADAHPRDFDLNRRGRSNPTMMRGECEREIPAARSSRTGAKKERP
jgi:hypothetical protein